MQAPRNHQVPGPGLNTTEPPEPTYNLRRRELKTIMKVVCGASADMSRMAVGLFGHERPTTPPAR